MLDNGLSIQGDDHTGAPIVKFFGTSINLGKSYYKMSGNMILWIIGSISDFLLKYPFQVILNLFLQPATNFAINDIIIPFFLENGLIEISGFR